MFQSELNLLSGADAFLREEPKFPCGTGFAPLSLCYEELQHCVRRKLALRAHTAEPNPKYPDFNLNLSYNLSHKFELNLKSNGGSPPGDLQGHY